MNYTLRHEIAHILAYKLLCNIPVTGMKVTNNGQAVVTIAPEYNLIRFMRNPELFDGVYLRNYACQAMAGPLADDPRYYDCWMHYIQTGQLNQMNCSDWATLNTVATIFSIEDGDITVDLESVATAKIGGKYANTGYTVNQTVLNENAALNTLNSVITTAYVDAKKFVAQHNHLIDQIAHNMTKQFGNSFRLNAKQIEFQLKKVGI